MPQASNAERAIKPHAPKIAAPVKVTGNIEAGKRLATKACAECHGTNGISPNETWPSLAGLSAAYLVRITTAYKTGDQNDVVMTPLAKKLSDADIQDLIRLLRKPAGGKVVNTPRRGDVEAGRSLAKNCAACHGETGIPTIRAWPLIAGLAPGYLVNVLKAFRAGLRKDPLMASAAKSQPSPGGERKTPVRQAMGDVRFHPRSTGASRGCCGGEPGGAQMAHGNRRKAHGA